MRKNTKSGDSGGFGDDADGTGPQPMDSTVYENRHPVVRTNTQRNCYAIDTLIAEVNALYPEALHEVSGYDGRNTGTDVTFDLSMLLKSDAATLTTLLGLVKSDRRVMGVVEDTEESQVLVSFWTNARIQDSRDPFGLSEALGILAQDGEDDEGGEGSW